MSFDWSLLGPPLLAGLLVVATHVTLGREVLKRGIIFIDLTIAQIAALGVIGLLAMGADDHGWPLQVAAGVSALVAAGVLSWTEHKFPQIQEPLIGSLYVVAASSALLLLAHSPHGAEHMTELLAGQILWVTYPQLLPVAGLYALVLVAWALAGERRRTLFYFLFALTVTASVQLVGVYLVFASLILPALAVLGMGRGGVWLAYGIGALGYALGLSISVPLDLPSGPLVVCVLAVLSLATGVIGRLLRGSQQS